MSVSSLAAPGVYINRGVGDDGEVGIEGLESRKENDGLGFVRIVWVLEKNELENVRSH